MIPYIGNDWDEILEKEFKKDYFQRLMNFLDYAYDYKDILPPRKDIFNALKTTSYKDTRIIIVGQDPYIKPNQAHGYSFSVLPGNEIPPSLYNIFKELHDDMGCYIPDNGCLLPWAEQGVLLLNSILTVEKGISNSHARKGWEEFTDTIIDALNRKEESMVFMLWGNYAKRKGAIINPNMHLVLKAAHPSPLAGGAFFGCKHFSLASQYLYETTPNTIDWQIPNIYNQEVK